VNAGALFIATIAMTTTAHPSTKDRPVFTLQLRAEPGVDPVLALRALLKLTLRRFGLRCVSVHEENDDERRDTF
jgi:hypothetical protein